MTCKIFFQDLIGGLTDQLISHNLPSFFVGHGMEINSKDVSKHSIFCAIKGLNRDGHEFIPEAISLGASCIVVDNPEVCEDLKKQDSVFYICVKNVVEAMGQMAAHRRRTTLEKCKVVAVTGSFGKTSVVQALYLTLSKFCEVSAPIKSYNNHIGVPFTIMNASNSASILVLEMGTNSAGEIAFLSHVGMPDIALITNVSSAHIGCFGNSIDNIVLAKAEIFEGLKPGGIVVLNEANESFQKLSHIAKEKGVKNILKIGLPEKSHVYLKSNRHGPFFTIECESFIFSPKGGDVVNFVINSFTPEVALNFLFVIGVVKLFKFDIETAVKVFPKIPTIYGRGNIEELHLSNKKVTIINSAYNSSPEALKIAIASLGQIKEMDSSKYERSVCFIGDMMELGDGAKSFHEGLLEDILHANIDHVCTVGENAKFLHNILPVEKKGPHFDSATVLSQNIKNLLHNKDIALFKASNSMNFGVVIDKLYK